MRSYRRKIERPTLRLKRDADGRLRPAAGNDDIGDIWAEQRRIRLNEAILADQKKAEKKQKRKQRLSNLLKKRPVGEPAPHRKEVVVNLTLPSVKLPKFKKPTVHLPKLGKKRLVIGGGALTLLVVGFVGYSLLGGGQPAKQPKKVATGAVNGVTAGNPTYPTVLPAGKTIQQLGGWANVAPANVTPVYAFVDMVNKVQVRVSEQPFPDKFKSDPDAGLAEIAKQFASSEVIQVDKRNVYIGTSAKGPQSVIASKKDLLILIKSDAKISNDQWAAYIAALQ